MLKSLIAFVAVETNNFKDDPNKSPEISIIARIAKRDPKGNLTFLAAGVCYSFLFFDTDLVDEALEFMYLSHNQTGSNYDISFGIGTHLPGVGLYKVNYGFNDKTKNFAQVPARFETLMSE